MSITSFSGSSGGVKANVNRWESQIGLNPSSIEDKSEFRRISRLGKYQVYELKNISNNDLAIIAAIFPLKEATLFVKLSINPNNLDNLRNAFIQFCDSIRNSEHV